MITFRFAPGCEIAYQTRHSAGADLKAREGVTLPPGGHGKVPTGVWIQDCLWDHVPAGTIPEVQIRARSGLAYRHGIMLTNGVGTVDADYRDEICVLLYNSSKETVTISAGDRIAQLVVALTYRVASLEEGGGERAGGFGSTGRR